MGLIDSGAAASLPVHPTQLYELVMVAALFIILSGIENRQSSPGLLALGAISGYAVLRFMIEFLRADSTLFLGTLTFTQIICIALLLAGIAGFARSASVIASPIGRQKN